MTKTDQDAYGAAWAAQARIAAHRRLAINHVIWRDGHMTCQMDPPQKAQPIEVDRPDSVRGCAQELLI